MLNLLDLPNEINLHWFLYLYDTWNPDSADDWPYYRVCKSFNYLHNTPEALKIQKDKTVRWLCFNPIATLVYALHCAYVASDRLLMNLTAIEERRLFGTLSFVEVFPAGMLLCEPFKGKKPITTKFTTKLNTWLGQAIVNSVNLLADQCVTKPEHTHSLYVTYKAKMKLFYWIALHVHQDGYSYKMKSEFDEKFGITSSSTRQGRKVRIKANMQCVVNLPEDSPWLFVDELLFEKAQGDVVAFALEILKRISDPFINAVTLSQFLYPCSRRFASCSIVK